MGADGFILLYSGGSHDGEKSAVHCTKLSVDGTFHPSRNSGHDLKKRPDVGTFHTDLANTFFTVEGYHFPPRAVFTPVLLRVSAIC